VSVFVCSGTYMGGADIVATVLIVLSSEDVDEGKIQMNKGASEVLELTTRTSL
jgi:hypothetical protein